ncbi:metal ABC transporter permease [Pseudoroseicyclus sp. CXY001]|uniref:metal ABC transporter permease n=1 Tax=Pseudoroseicyclus sp. CXY001 TaxID=3242492 RepID=UPI003570B367
MLDSFLMRAALAGLGVALVTAPLGCFVVWRRMAYFGHATAHASVLGVALGLALSISVVWGALAVALVMGGLVAWLGRRGHSSDAAIGVISHAALAFGLVAVALTPGLRGDLTAWLFGDILAVTRGDLAVIWGSAAAVVALLAWRWRRLLTATLGDDLARAAGIDPRREELVLVLALAVVVAVALKVVGALLISALLVIPAAAARPLARTPEAMAAVAAAIGVTSALGGLWVAFLLDTPAGPSIVCLSSVIFAVTSFVPRR